jgi:hypothetical protein
MDVIEVKMPNYPALRFVAQHGRQLVWVIAALVVVAGAGLSLSSGTPLRAVAWLLAGVVVLAVGRVLVELVELITDMLLPK